MVSQIMVNIGSGNMFAWQHQANTSTDIISKIPRNTFQWAVIKISDIFTQ